MIELCLNEDKAQRLKSTDELIATVKSIQRAALVCSQVARGSLAGSKVTLELCRPGEETSRYSLHVVDHPGGVKKKFAAFIVPQGR